MRIISFLFVTALLLGSSWLMWQWNIDLTTESAPYGMVSYELVGGIAQTMDGTSPSAATNNILQEWQQRNVRDIALFSLGFDYAYMLIYTGWLLLVMWLLRSRSANEHYAGSGRHGPRKLSITLGIVMGLTALIVPADAIENYYLTCQILQNTVVDHTTLAAAIAASVKFALILLAIISILVLLVKNIINELK